MAGIQLSTAGVTLNWAIEPTPGTMPTTGFKEVPEVKSIPELNPEPDNLESTTLKETEWKTYVPGLKDPGGALSFTANLTQLSMEEWEDMVEQYETAAAANKGMWFAIIVPGLTKALLFKGAPSPMGMPGMEVSSILEINLYITPTGAPSWQAKPTITGGTEPASYSARQSAKKTNEVDV